MGATQKEKNSTLVNNLMLLEHFIAMKGLHEPVIPAST